MRSALATALLATMVIPALGDNVSVPGDIVVVSAPIFGCSAEQNDKLNTLAAQGDREAFRSYLLSQVISGACLEFPKGTALTVESVSMWKGTAQVRPRGKPDSVLVTWAMLNKHATKKGRID